MAMATLEQLLSDLMYEVGAGDIPDIIRLTNRHLRRIAMKREWRHYQTTGGITVLAAYSTGTATLTNGSGTVTGSGTTWTSAMVGRKFMAANSSGIFTITARASNTSITIDPVWPYDTEAGLSYWIFQNEYSLPTNMQKMLPNGLVDAITQKPLRSVTWNSALKKWWGFVNTDLDIARIAPVTWPWEYAQFKADDSNIAKLIFNAVGDADRDLDMYYYRYPTAITDISQTPDLPEYLEEYLLQCLVETYRGRAVPSNEVTLAFRNERLNKSMQEKVESWNEAVAHDTKMVTPYIRTQRALF